MNLVSDPRELRATGVTENKNNADMMRSHWDFIRHVRHIVRNASLRRCSSSSACSSCRLNWLQHGLGSSLTQQHRSAARRTFPLQQSPGNTYCPFSGWYTRASSRQLLYIIWVPKPLTRQLETNKSHQLDFKLITALSKLGEMVITRSGNY